MTCKWYCYYPVRRFTKENKLLYTNHSGNLTYYTYDLTGNTISTQSPNGEVTTSTYDYERRLTSISLPSGETIRYKYLPNGDRIMRENSTTPTDSPLRRPTI